MNVTIDGRWENGIREAEQVKNFISSLRSDMIGAGLVGFDAEHFHLYPRSWYFSNRLCQFISSVGDKGSTFEKVLSGFVILTHKIHSLKRLIEEMNLSQLTPHFSDIKKLHRKLIKIDILINNAALEGLQLLCKNYRDLKKFEKANQLNSLGQDAFHALKELQKKLSDRLISHQPSLEADIELEKHCFAARKIVNKRQQFCQHLQSTTWQADKGVIIPLALIQDCIQDAKKKQKNISREALRLAAHYIQLPKEAEHIPTQNNQTAWHPIRMDHLLEGAIEKTKGVFGTCERTEGEASNICNLYYRLNPDTHHFIVSCGAINTSHKIDQLVTLADVIVNQHFASSTYERWHIHGLYSFFKEKNVIQDTQACLPYFHDKLQQKLKKEGRVIKVSQINTVFNAACVLLQSEDAQSLQSINIDSLAQLIEYALEDLICLLKESLANEEKEEERTKKATRLFNEIWQSSASVDTFTKIQRLRQEIQTLKKAIALPKKMRAAALPKHQGLDTPLMAPQREEMRANHLSCEEEEICQIDAEGLKSKQIELEQELKHFAALLSEPIATLEKKEHVALRKAVLIFKVLQVILQLQVKLPLSSSFSRCTEIELLLLLYRLLQIKPIIICWSGLDRSGSVRALADTQEHFERMWTQQYQEKMPGGALSARMAAQERLFDLILQLDPSREKLFKLINTLCKEKQGQFTFLQELAEIEKEPSHTFHLREALPGEIDKRHPAQEAQLLTSALYYMEWYAKQLLGTEMLKTIYSTGVAGFKWHQDISWLKRYFSANPHPLQRLPPLLTTQNRHLVQLMKYKEGWLSCSTELTPQGMALLLRLSQLRGT